MAGSLRSDKRAAAMMSLIRSAKLNELDPCAYLRDALKRLPTQPACRSGQLMPHQWIELTSLANRAALRSR